MMMIIFYISQSLLTCYITNTVQWVRPILYFPFLKNRKINAEKASDLSKVIQQSNN